MSKSENVIALVLAQAFNAGINFFFLPYLVRALDPEAYGTYGQVLLVADIVKSLFSLNLSMVMFATLGVSDKPKDDFRTLLISSTVLGMLSMAFMAGLAAPISRLFASSGIRSPLTIYSAHLVFFFPFTILSSLLIFLGDMRRYVALFVGALLFRVFIVVVAVETFHSVDAIFWSLLILTIAQFSVAIVFVPKDFLTLGKFDFSKALEHARLGAQLGYSGLMGLLIGYTDKLMISTILSVEAFAIYRNGAIEIPILSTIYTSVAAIYLPVVAVMFGEGRYRDIAKLKRKSINLTAAAIYPPIGFLVVFSHGLVTAYFSQKYSSSAGVFGIMTMGLLLRINDYMDVLVAARKGRLLMLIYSGALVANCIVNWVCISLFGYLGAALATNVTYMLLFTTLVVASARILAVSPWDILDWRTLGLVFFISFALPASAKVILGDPADITTILAIGIVSMSVAYGIFLRLGLVVYSDASPIIRKLPGAGPWLDAQFHASFPERGA